MEKIQLELFPVGPGSFTRECRPLNPADSPKLEKCNGKVRSGREGGFTLIEILMALTIFSVSFLALAAGATTVMQSNKTSYMSTVATNLAQDKLEELMATSAASIAAGGPVTDTVDGVVFTRNWTVTTDSPVAGINQIDVTVSWKGNTLTVRSAFDL